MKAVIMAGGEGTRLRPLTCKLPKPMVPVLNKPVMEYSIELLKQHNVKDIAVTLMFMPQCIINYFGDGKERGVNLSYFTENEPLGTAGSVKNAQEFLDETFVIISGDALTDIDLTSALEFHKSHKSLVTLVLRKEEKPLEYGVVHIDKQGKINRFVEKPPWEKVTADTVNTGIYIIEPEILNKIPHGTNFDFGKQLFPQLLAEEVPMFGYVTEDYWCDIGDIAAYVAAHRDVLDGKVRVSTEVEQYREGVFLEPYVHIGSNVTLNPPVYIGRGTTIADNSTLGPYCIIGSNSHMDSCNIEGSVLWRNVRVQYGAMLNDTIVCNNANIGKRCIIEGSSVLGDDSVVKDDSLIRFGVHIWNNKQTEPCSVINRTIRYGNECTGELFDDRGIQGQWGDKITPELALALGQGLAKLFNGTIIGAHSGSPAAATLLNTLLSGACAAGNNSINAGILPLSSLRYNTWAESCAAGVHINIFEENVYITLVNYTGADITSAQAKKLQALMARGELTVQGSTVGISMQLKNGAQLYKVWIGNRLGGGKSRGLVLGGDYATASMAGDVLKNMGYGSILLQNASQEQFSNAILSQAASGGIVFGLQGEITEIYDEMGKKATLEQYFLLRATLCRLYGAKNVILPSFASAHCEQLVKENGCNVLRVGQHRGDAMQVLLGDASISSEQAFFITFDGIYMAASLLRQLELQNNRLSTLLQKGLPSVCCNIISCTNAGKGRLMQAFAENAQAGEAGLSIEQKNATITILPDNNKPICRIYGVSFSEEYAADITAEFTKKAQDILAGDRN